MLKLIKFEGGREVERPAVEKAQPGARQTAETSETFLACLIGDATHHLGLLDYLDNDQIGKVAVAIVERIRQRGIAE